MKGRNGRNCDLTVVPAVRAETRVPNNARQSDVRRLEGDFVIFGRAGRFYLTKLLPHKHLRSIPMADLRQIPKARVDG